ncbi:hypothetical protein [Novosphingobium naphthalenivorans]|uniref:hypothetical protein n=1 Tax=Novosphingobium naphthalenivorans TaxID=273168 RepID=UPI0012EDEA0B|nr:hypothetical protein [Novosphingobium naphthalenivorans]
MDALSAVRELRWQFNRPRVDVREPFPGKRAGSDPETFLLATYGDVIRDGSFGPGRLSNIDSALYIALQRDLSKKNPSETIGDFFERHATERGSATKAYARKAAACAELLGATEMEASRFFGGIRADRTSKWVNAIADDERGRGSRHK